MKICVITDINNKIKAYGVCLTDGHIPLENGVIVETDLELGIVELVGNYKLVDDELIELTEEEKPTIEPQPTELEILKQDNLMLNEAVTEMTMLISMILEGMM